MRREEAPPCPMQYPNNPSLQRSWEQYWRETYRPLSTAEKQGWRRYWDGWCICPSCLPGQLSMRRKPEWGVPANYHRPIRPDETCMHCHRTPLQVPTPEFTVAAIMEIYSYG